MEENLYKFKLYSNWDINYIIADNLTDAIIKIKKAFNIKQDPNMIEYLSCYVYK